MRFEFIVAQPLAAAVGPPARSVRRVPLDAGSALEAPSIVTGHAPTRDDAFDRAEPTQPLAVDAGGANLDDELALPSTTSSRSCGSRVGVTG